MQKGKSINSKRPQKYDDDENDFEEFNQRPQKKMNIENREVKKSFNSNFFFIMILKVVYRERW